MSRLEEPEKQGEAQLLTVTDQEGWAGPRAAAVWQRPSSGPVHSLCGLPGWCASSQSGSASDKPPMEVSCAVSETQQRGEKLVEQHTCPHR